MIDEALRLNAEKAGMSYLWLADAYDTLPDYDSENPGAEGTTGPVASDWRSPFVGSSAEEAADFIRAAPKPSKPLSKLFFAVLIKEQFEHNKQLLIYKILRVEGGNDDEVKLQSVPVPIHLASCFFTERDRYPQNWDRAIKQQWYFYGTGADWDDDCGEGIDVMALIVLDEFPIEVRVQTTSFAPLLARNSREIRYQHRNFHTIQHPRTALIRLQAC